MRAGARGGVAGWVGGGGVVSRWRHGVGTHRCVYGMIQDVDVSGELVEHSTPQ